ncbi:MAG TPA: gliding motility lipoprotein GldB, partial [Chryseosolibacter sp.]|nr:gliding motility lipoprotein GldB [Chryseosolibacter sp.]
MKKILYVLVLAALFACERGEEEKCAVQPDVSENVSVHFEHFQDSLINISSKRKLLSLLSRQPGLRDYIFRRGEYPDDSVFVQSLMRKFNNRNMDTLYMETKRIFGDHSDLERQFTEAFTNLKHYYPDFNPPKVQTVVSGLDSDMLVSDTLIIISLDFYLGRKGKYRPQMYEYILRRYDPEDIVPSCMLLYGIDAKRNATDLNDKTVLAEMIAYGKSFYFAKHMLPCVPDSVFVWYTPSEIKGARENEDLIWDRFLQDKVIFSTSMITKRNYVGERPFTSQVG